MSIRVKDKDFDVYLNEKTILKRVKELGTQISREYADMSPLFVGILNGSFIFASDLVKCIDIPCEISFVKVASYEEMQSTGEVSQLIGLNESVNDRHVIILEDIIDSGRTMHWLVNYFTNLGAKSIEITTLLHKPDATQKAVSIKYLGFEIPNKFVVGYGLDYDGYGRNLRDIYQLKG